VAEPLATGRNEMTATATQQPVTTAPEKTWDEILAEAAGILRGVLERALKALAA
jgi:hypothetical protein